MAATIITTEDLAQFKTELLSELQKLLPPQGQTIEKTEVKWLKSHQVQRQLGISPGTLQNLRINGTIPYTKIGGVIFYSQEDINSILQKNMRNTNLHAKK